MLAALALTITTSAALTLSLTRNTSLASLTSTNTTSSALQPPADLPNSMTRRPWPKIPYSIILHGIGSYRGAELSIQAVFPFPTSPAIRVHELQLFVEEFADNFRQEYPVPGFIPREVSQYTIDVWSYTKWSLWLKEGIFHGRLPTVVALAALGALENELGKYEQAGITYAILRNDGIRGAWTIGEVRFQALTGASLNDSLLNENDRLQTA